jgi:hypothetical protein
LNNRVTLLVVAASAFLALAAALLSSRGIPSSAVVIDRLEAGVADARWYRGNLHTHTTASDGDASATDVAAWYRRHGYDFIALTDHDAVPGPLPSGGAASLLLIPGEELSDAVGTTSLHLTALGVDHTVPHAGGGDVPQALQRDADAIAAAGGIAQVNHPNYAYAITAEQLMGLRGLQLFEVFNGHPLSHNAGDVAHPSTERLWDIALAFRVAGLRLPLLYGVASDDAHNYSAPSPSLGSPGRGWVMVLAGSKSQEAITTALQAGRFYASTGVALRRIVHYDRGLAIEVEPVAGVSYRIDFVGTRSGFDPRSVPATRRDGSPAYASRVYSSDIGRVLATQDGPRAEYVFDRDDLYVRATVTASRRHPNPSEPLQYEMAWVQPVPGPAATRRMPGLAVPPPPPASLHAATRPRFRRLSPAELAAVLARRTVDCNADRVADAKGPPGLSFTQRDHVQFGGWLAERTDPTVPDAVGILLRGGASFLAEGSNGVQRGDVAKVLGNPALEGAGFNIEAPLEGVPHDTYSVLLVGWHGKRPLSCDTGKRLRVHAL